MKLSILFLVVAGVYLCNSSPANHTYQPKADEMWIASVAHGISSFHDRPNEYAVYRNVMDFGCRGDGVTDDTACINTAISSGARCGDGCGSSTITPALIYFPSGQYLISSPIIMYYYSQLVGNKNDPPVLIADPSFQGMAVLDSNPYGSNGWNWYTNQNNFFRQVRNFVIDLTRKPANQEVTGIHWQVAQATSLVNLHFKMSTEPGNQHQGLWMENGSGGFMSDLTFDGGKFGMWVGNQQFLTINLVFNDCATGVYMNWNWQWTFKGCTFNRVGLAIDMSAPSDTKRSGVGSILVLDSTFNNVLTGVLLNNNPPPTANDVSGTLLLDNLRVENSPVVVADTSGGRVLEVSGSTTIPAWGRGSVYNDESGNAAYRTDYLPTPNKSPSLLDGQGRFYQKSRPQYETVNANDFANVKDGGARGDGNTDDSDAIQNVINANVNGKIVYFPAGTYILGKTVKVPPGTRMIGETWSILMAGGAAFQNENQPQPMLQVGEPGQTGMVEITDFMFASKGAQPGAILVQWNIRESSQGSAAMWDCHMRVGGTQGSNLQVAQCPKGGNYKPECVGVHTLLHLTPSSSGYFENVWAWTADHDLDNHQAQGQVTLYAGRGVLVESRDGPVWLYGTQSEHNVLYQYQLDNAKNVFMTMIQSETPYWQPGPPAPQPFTPNNAFTDPSYQHCAAGDLQCAMSWAVRIVQCNNVYIYGAGLYNFFFNYDQTCLNTESCQTAMIDLEGNSGVYMYNINTKAAINVAMVDNTRPIVVSAHNSNGFCQTVNALLSQS